MRRSFYPCLAAAWCVTFGMPSPVFARQVEQQQIETLDVPPIALTPQALAEALACRSREAYQAFRLKLSGDTASIPWLESYFAEESNGMPGVYAYRLDAPIPFFGRAIGSVFFTDDGVLASLPRTDALELIADKKLERLPAKRTRQYYRFLDPQAGAVLIALEPEEPALSAALDARLGVPHGPQTPPQTIFVGCSYTRLSRSDFLKRAAYADQRLDAHAEILARIAKARSEEKP